MTTRTLRWYDSGKHNGIAELYATNQAFAAYCAKHLPGCTYFLRNDGIHWA